MTSREKTMGAQGTLCWGCEWAAGKDHKCPWSTKFKPVPGWNATPTKIVVNEINYKKTIHSFFVKECPLFEKMELISLAEKAKAKKEAEKKAHEDAITRYKQKREETLKTIERLWLEEHLSQTQIAESVGWSGSAVQRAVQKIKEEYNGRT
jgi:hypothetical protein